MFVWNCRRVNVPFSRLLIDMKLCLTKDLYVILIRLLTDVCMAEKETSDSPLISH